MDEMLRFVQRDKTSLRAAAKYLIFISKRGE